jgi:hypothetical protein
MFGLFSRAIGLASAFGAIAMGVGAAQFFTEGSAHLKQAEEAGWINPNPPKAPLSVFEQTVARTVFGNSWGVRGTPCRTLVRTWTGLGDGKTPGGMVISRVLARDMKRDLEKPRNAPKIDELALSCTLEGRYTDAAMLRAWLDHTYAGKGFDSFEAASQGLFNKPTAQLNQDESAKLTALVEVPNLKSNPERWERRTKDILASLEEPSVEN